MATPKKKQTAKPKKPAATRKAKPVSKTKVAARRSPRPARLKSVIRKRVASPPRPAGLPEILFEGDRPGLQPVGPGERFALGAPQVERSLEDADLPEAYGTQQVLVAPRDPHWLYVHWDLTREQLRDYNAQSIHKHLVLRLTKPEADNEPAGEIHVHPESRHWFVHVAEAGVKYAVELGYYGKAKGWTTVSVSKPALAPREAVSGETTTQFTTVPPDVALSRLLDIVKTGAREQLPLAHALEELRVAGHPELPAINDGGKPKPWTPEQERALAEIINLRQFGRVSVASMDITELVQRGLQQDFSSVMAALGGLSSLSSPTGGAPGGSRSFWFNVNAELIIYGATERDAKVSIGGQNISLRPDGSFSYRFALPDGQYELPVTAVSADDTEARHANLQFSRATQLVGEVGQHPQDPALKPPTPEGVS